MPGTKKDGSPYAPRKDSTQLANKIDPTKTTELKDILQGYWDGEVSLLVALYDHEDVFTGEKDLWKEVKFRNGAIISQLDHIKKIAQFIGGAINESAKNSKESKEKTKDLVEEAASKIEEKKKEWNARKKKHYGSEYGQ